MTNKFYDITDPELRAWNRCAMIFNLGKDQNMKVAANYAASFDEDARKEISHMFNRIKTDGYERTRAEINRNVQRATLVA